MVRRKIGKSHEKKSSALKRLSSIVFILIVVLSQGMMAQNTGLGGFANSSSDSLLTARSQARDAESRANTGNYSASTTRFTYERDFKFNTIAFQRPDTLPDNLHRFTDLARFGYTGQNLGNIGTAYRELFPEPSLNVGRQSGYHVFDVFATSPEDIRYYDTRSPYTDVQAYFGGNGRAVTKVTFTLNDSTQFNIGGTLNSIRSDKQLAFLTRGDRQVQSNDYNVFGFLRPQKIPKYLLLFNATQFKHTVNEQGGIIDPALDVANEEADFFAYQDASVLLTEAVNLDQRSGVHIYQQYDFDSLFQFYHSGDFQSQKIQFDDVIEMNRSDSLFYNPPSSGLATDTLAERSRFSAFTNELGIKGQTPKFSYTAYYKNRIVGLNIETSDFKERRTEHYVGGTLRQNITPKIFLVASGEFLFDGAYFLEGNFSSDLFEVTYARQSRLPSFLESRYEGKQRQWVTNFDNEISDYLKAQIKLYTKNFSVRPFLSFNRMANYIYFSQEKLPDQTSADVVVLQPGLHFDWHISPKIAWKNTLRYQAVSGGASETYPLPEWLGLSQVSYKNVLFDGKMILQTGIDAHFRSAYQGLAYDPVIQQYHLQNDFTNDSFVKIDVFLNFKVSNFLLFLNVAHVNQGLFSENNGYFITPFFTGTQQSVDVGVRWMFFD